MTREQVTTVHRRQAGGGHVACAPAAGRVPIPVHTYMQSCPHTHAPGGANIRASSCPKVPCAVIAVAIVVPFLPCHCCRNLGYVASVGPFLPGHCCLGRQRCFHHGKDRCPATIFQIFCTAKSSEALQKVAKMPETTREFRF